MQWQWWQHTVEFQSLPQSLCTCLRISWCEQGTEQWQGTGQSWEYVDLCFFNSNHINNNNLQCLVNLQCFVTANVYVGLEAKIKPLFYLGLKGPQVFSTAWNFTYIDYCCLSLRHVCDDSICYNEQDKVFWTISDWRSKSEVKKYINTKYMVNNVKKVKQSLFTCIKKYNCKGPFKLLSAFCIWWEHPHFYRLNGTCWVMWSLSRWPSSLPEDLSPGIQLG